MIEGGREGRERSEKGGIAIKPSNTMRSEHRREKKRRRNSDLRALLENVRGERKGENERLSYSVRLATK